VIKLSNKVELEAILGELIKYPEINDKQILEQFADDFNEIYSDSDYRHSYYEISLFIGEQDQEVRTSLVANLEKILRFISSKSDKYNFNTDKGLLKLLDHVSLETLRLERIDEVKYLSEKFSKATVKKVYKSRKEIDENKTKIEEYLKQISETKEKLDNVHTELVTVLGAFASIVVGFATTFQLMSQSFVNLDDIHFFKIIAYLCVIGIILFDCLFLLLFSVARISKRSLALRCKKEDCEKCKKKNPCKSEFYQVQVKYPYVIWFNAINIIIFSICCIYGVLYYKLF